jgi:hypothetical protein
MSIGFPAHTTKQFDKPSRSIVSCNFEMLCLVGSGRAKKNIDFARAVNIVLDFSPRQEASEHGPRIAFQPVIDMIFTDYLG